MHTHRQFFPSSENLDRTQSHIFTRDRLHFSKLTYPWKMTHLQMTYPWNMLISIAFCILTLKPKLYLSGLQCWLLHHGVSRVHWAGIQGADLMGTHPIQIGHGTRKTDFWYSRDSMFSWQKWRNWVTWVIFSAPQAVPRGGFDPSFCGEGMAMIFTWRYRYRLFPPVVQKLSKSEPRQFHPSMYIPHSTCILYISIS